jgi:hypothetical protein
MKGIASVFFSVFLLVGCQTGVVPVYSIYGDTNFAIKSIGISEKIGFGTFSSHSLVDMGCRAVGEVLLPRGQTPNEYIQKAIETELKVANLYSIDSPKIVLSGTLNKVLLSTTNPAPQDSSWDLNITVKSSNGRTLNVDEYYQFDTRADTRCKEAADAFVPATQNLIVKIFTSPHFKNLIQKN